jgi:hypothetical protein
MLKFTDFTLVFYEDVVVVDVDVDVDDDDAISKKHPMLFPINFVT